MNLSSLKSRLSGLDQTNKQMRLVAKFAARETGISVEELRGPSRQSEIVAVRWAVMAEARAAGFTTTQIGRFFNRDHSTVCHATRGKSHG